MQKRLKCDKYVIVKGTVSVISSDPPCKDGPAMPDSQWFQWYRCESGIAIFTRRVSLICTEKYATTKNSTLRKMATKEVYYLNQIQ